MADVLWVTPKLIGCSECRAKFRTYAGYVNHRCSAELKRVRVEMGRRRRGERSNG